MHTTPVTPTALTIAGSDSGGGAGIQADLKTFAALGVYGCSAVASLTAQNTLGVHAVLPVPSDFVRLQIQSVLSDINVGAIKTGMLATADIIAAVAATLADYPQIPLVLDPVMVATSGSVLIDKAAVAVLVRELFPRVTVITPNLDEAALLVGRALTSAHDMEQAALALLAQGARAVVLKGGHLPGDTVIDLLLTQTGEKVWMQAPRIHSPNTHGTGCTLASACAAGLAMGRPLEVAVVEAWAYVGEAIRRAPGLGGGHGPLDHGWPVRG